MDREIKAVFTLRFVHFFPPKYEQNVLVYYVKKNISLRLSWTLLNT